MTATLSKFHGIYDADEYAKLGGDYLLFENSLVCMRAIQREHSLITGPGASFGGVAFNQKLVDLPSLESLTEAVRSFISLTKDVTNLQSIVLRMGADCYYPTGFFRTLQSAFLVENWRWTGEVTFVVARGEFAPRSSVERNVRKASRSGLRVECITPQDCYQLMRKVKDVKGYQFSYTEDRIVQQLQLFPESFGCYGVVTEAGELVAALLEVQHPGWSLLLNWDQTDQGRTLCATDYLLHQRLLALFDQGVDFVDLGTLTLSRQVNWGLTRHKQNFGGHCEVRNSFTYFASS